MSKYRLLNLLAVTAACSFAVSCSGGSDGLDEDTVSAPTTLDDLVLTIPGSSVQIEFVRSSTSTRNVTTGLTEFGNCILTSSGGISRYDSSIGRATEIYWPNTIEQMSYTYSQINDTSGLLQITTSNGDYADVNNLQLGDFFNNDEPWAGLFHNAIDTGITSGFAAGPYPTAQPPHPSSHVTNFFLNFDTDGSTVTEVGIRMAAQSFQDVTRFSILNRDSVFAFTARNGVVIWLQFHPTVIENLTFFITGGRLLTNTGAPVPIDYEQDQLTGDIVPDSLDIETIVFTPNSGGPNFEIEFNAIESEAFEETGVGRYLDVTPPVAVTENITYIYRHDEGIDSARLILNSSTVPTQTRPGRYTLDFLTIGETSLGNRVQTGTYINDTTGDSGTFRISSNSFN